MMIALRNSFLVDGGSSYEYQPLCFTAEEANSTVKLYKAVGTPPAALFSISYDGNIWQDYTEGDVITLANVGDKVYFAARGDTVNTQMSSGTRALRRFNMTGSVAASGNIMSLVKNDPTGWDVQIGVRCFYQLFYNSTSLTTAPELPGTKLNTHVYYQMFNGCSSLRTGPSILPCTTSYSNMYYYMFNQCSLLEKAPEIMLIENSAQACMV